MTEIPAFGPSSVSSILPSLLELLEELLRLEVLRDGLVVPGDHLVDLLLPAALGVLAVAHRHEELPQRRLHHRQKVVGYLKVHQLFNQFYYF